MTFDRYQLESHLMCGQKGYYLHQGIRPRRYLIPHETRRRIERFAPGAVCGQNIKPYVNKIRSTYEKQASQRGLAVAPEDNSYTVFTRENALLAAMLLAVYKRFDAGLKPKLEFLEAYNPGLIVDRTYWTFRVMSRWDNALPLVIDQSISLDALRLADQNVNTIMVCPIITGRRAGDHYDNPFCRMYRDEATGSSAWAATFEERGKTRRLGKNWKRVALTETDHIETWIDNISDIQRLAGDPWYQVFPSPVRLPLDSQMLERGRYFAQQLQKPNRERNYRACLFPGQCEYFPVCWMNESEHGPNWIKE